MTEQHDPALGCGLMILSAISVVVIIAITAWWFLPGPW